MKKVALAVLLAGGMVSGVALADEHSVSVGYAQSKVQDFKNIRGVNLQYRYEWDSPVSVMGSFTYMKGDDDQNYYLSSDYINNHVEAKYYSLLVGPAFRINEYVSLYALGGVAAQKLTATRSGTTVATTTWVAKPFPLNPPLSRTAQG